MFDQNDLNIIAENNCYLTKGGVIITEPLTVVANTAYIIYANDGYLINSITMKNMMGGTNSLTVSSNKKYATLNSGFTGAQLSDIKLDVVADAVEGCFSTAIIKTINDNNCDLYYEGVLIEKEKYGSVGSTYTIKCRDGWIFNTEKDSLGGYAVYGRFLQAGGVWSIDQWEISEDKLTATKTLESATSRDYTTIVLSTDQNVPIDVMGGVNNIYKVDTDIMKALTKERFFTTNTGSNGSYMTFDYGQFIINLMQLPFSLPENNIIGSEPIQLAQLQTTVTAPMVNTDRVTYDLGEISINGNHGNLLDYTTKQAILHLPFSDPLIIENKYIIDQTINVQLTINLYTGTGTYNIYSSAIDEVIITKTVTLGVNIPMANFYSSDPKQILNSSMEWAGDNNLRIVYIELVDNNSDLNKGFFNTPIMDDTTLNNVSGFYTVINADLVLNATTSEKNSILSMLKSGVIYK